MKSATIQFFVKIFILALIATFCLYFYKVADMMGIFG